ncbi:TPA: hypothetical protein ACH3X3_003524 [Trebouxia sp. C0006]
MRQQVTQVAQGQNWQGGIQQLPKITPGVSAIPTAAQRLHSLDSRACAALLKDLSKNGLPHHALAIFDWLQSLPSEHELSSLCDTFTYPTVISTAVAGDGDTEMLAPSPRPGAGPRAKCIPHCSVLIWTTGLLHAFVTAITPLEVCLHTGVQ